SIVWSMPDGEAARVLELGDDAFAADLARAFGARLGEVQVESARAAFPLRLRLADTALAGRLLLLGDAAHVVHPLAGQGVNLGLRDVSGLRALVAGGGDNWDSPHRLRRWARRRRSENTMAALAFDGIDRVFSNDAVLPTLLRGHLLGAAARVPPVSHLLWRRAAGLCTRPRAAWLNASTQPAGQLLPAEAAIAIAVRHVELGAQRLVAAGLVA